MFCNDTTFSAADNVTELAHLIAALAPLEGKVELPIPGVHLIRISRNSRGVSHGVSFPCLCLVGQGSKIVQLSNTAYRYDESNMLIYAAEVPVTSQVERASMRDPFLCFMLDLNPQRLAELVLRAYPHGIAAQNGDGRAIYLSKADRNITAAAISLLKLLEKPEDAPFLAPIITDEIIMRLLLGPMGHQVARIAHSGSPFQRINKAICWLKENFCQTFRVEDLAELTNMSLSTFHHHFKSVTSMSPLQYQKALRLQEARRLMLTSAQDVSSACQAVGYCSASQFSREYSRMFGDTPTGDINKLRSNNQIS